jgi:hypothetical protein
MTIFYHQLALKLAKATCTYNKEMYHIIQNATQKSNIALPSSIIEWLCIDPESRLFHKITQFPHEFITIYDIESHISFQEINNRLTHVIQIISENQGCFAMAASLEDGDDPPVYVSFNFHYCTEGEKPTWQLQSRSFSTCILSFAWDFNAVNENNDLSQIRNIEDMPAEYTTIEEGPTTYTATAWFYGEEFRRFTIDGKCYLFLVPDGFHSV